MASVSRSHRIPRHRGDGFGQLRIRATQQVVTGGTLCCYAPAQAQQRTDRGQGLKTLQRVATNIAAFHKEMTRSRTKWSWDCLTPTTALTGRSVSASAYVFFTD